MALVAKNFQDIITFSRATQTGTYVNSSGYITNSSVLNYLTYSNQPENAAWTKSNSFVQQNVLIYSQDFDNANWGLSGVSTPTSNTTIAPDGTLTADTVTATASTTQHLVTQTTAGLTATPITISIYAKANTHSFLQIFHGALATNHANFNISTGVVGTVGAGFTSASMTSVGNGWFRCIVILTPTATSNVRFALVTSNTAVYNESWTATGTESIYLWGAQCVQGSVPGDYRATTSAALPCLYPDYNGALRARKLCEDTAAASHLCYETIATVSGNIYTSTIRIKAAERGFAQLRYENSGSTQLWAANVNLTDGTYTTTTFGSPTITSVSVTSQGNGWWLVSVSASSNNTQWKLIVFTQLSLGVNSYTGDGSSGIYIADTQLNDGSSALAYYDTTQYAYNAPRFDYDPVTLAAKGLLVEESRANLLTYSGDFASAAWTKNNSTLTSNAAISPDGTVTADKLISNVGVFGTASQAPTVVVSTTYTYSIYAKAAEFSWLRFQVNLITGTRIAWFNLASGTVGTVQAGLTASIVSAGNGFYRCIVAAIADNTNGSLLPGATNADNSATNGDGVSGIYIWGAQCETGAFATSYIPTVASQVTRAADVASVNTLSPWFNSVAGTLYAEFDVASTAGPSMGIAALDNGAATGYMFYKGTAASTLSGYAGAFSSLLGSISANTTAKAAVAYDGVNNAGDLNAAAPVVITAGAVSAPTRLVLGSWWGSSPISGHLRRITYYPRRLTNAELQTLTTL